MKTMTMKTKMIKKKNDPKDSMTNEEYINQLKNQFTDWKEFKPKKTNHSATGTYKKYGVIIKNKNKGVASSFTSTLQEAIQEALSRVDFDDYTIFGIEKTFTTIPVKNSLFHTYEEIPVSAKWIPAEKINYDKCTNSF